MPTQSRSQATYDSIVDAAARLLERHGYAALTTNHVAEAAGVAIGLLAAVALTPVMAGQLYETRTADPLTLTAVPALLLLTALAASALPARRATRVDPLVALQSE